jgi:hypothetical protein
LIIRAFDLDFLQGGVYLTLILKPIIATICPTYPYREEHE